MLINLRLSAIFHRFEIFDLKGLMKFSRNYKIEQEPNISHVHVAYPHKSRFMYEPGFSISNSTQTSKE
jgi:hypothetical protein